LRNFRKSSHKRIDNKIIYLSTLSQKQQKLLEKYSRYLNSAKQCVDANFRVIEKMLANVDNLFVNSKSNIEAQDLTVPFEDSEKVVITLKQIVRDWTDIGSQERDQCYKPILQEIERYFPMGADTKENQYKIVNK
jgi:hypothetical protein